MENDLPGIVGAGWVGAAFARHWNTRGGKCWGTTTRRHRQEALLAEGIEAHLINLDDQRGMLESTMPYCSVMIMAFPPGGKDRDRSRYPQRLEAAVEAGWKGGCRNFIMLSSTSVYRNTGTWVNEDQENHLDSGSDVLRGELAFHKCLSRRSDGDMAGLVLRLSGLFGPERHPGRWLAGGRFPTTAALQSI